MMRPRGLVIAIALGAAAGCALVTPLGELQGGDGGAAMAEGGDDAPADVQSDMGSPSDAGDAMLLPCTNTVGPALVRMQAGLCIDSTEVTRAQYVAFLSTNPPTTGQIAECAWNSSFVPITGLPTATDFPITSVDWCDAYGYCKWAGKELCGSVGDGGPVSMGSFLDPAVSMWHRACTKNGAQLYPYGTSQKPGACNCDMPEGGKAAVGTFLECEGGYPGIFDMVGNVGEWENACTPVADGGPAADSCRRRGGAYDDPASCAYPEVNPRNYVSSALGFRCCKHD